MEAILKTCKHVTNLGTSTADIDRLVKPILSLKTVMYFVQIYFGFWSGTIFSLKMQTKEFPAKSATKMACIHTAHIKLIDARKRRRKSAKLMASPLTLINCGQHNIERSEKQKIGVTKTAYALFLVFSKVRFQLKTLNQIYLAFFSFYSRFGSIKKRVQSLSSLIEMVKIKMDAEGKMGISGHVQRPLTNC